MCTRLLILFVLLFTHLITQGQDFDSERYDGDQLSKRTQKLVKKIAKENAIYTKAIGFSGKRTTQYDRFEKLSETATTKELIVLMNHKNPAVRGYSFWALAKRYYEDLGSVFITHANDEELVFQMDGCIGGDIPVIDFMRWVAMPEMIDTDCKKLDKSDFEKVRKKRGVNH